MSHNKNKVRWCINKAKKELNEGNKHRGLMKIESNVSEAKKHLKKAEHNFKMAINMEKFDGSDWAVSAIFYSIYHCFLAIITKFGYESRNQDCTIALIGYLKEQDKIKLDQDIIDELILSEHEDHHQRNTIELRENFQYGTQTTMDDKRLKELKNLSRKAIDQTKKIIYFE
jgi:uncharacterized protein (UPF0332 family)